MIGDVDGGWAVAMHLMQYERGMYGYAVLNKVLTELSRLRDDMASHGARPPRTRALRTGLRRRGRRAGPDRHHRARSWPAGASVGPDSSIDKLLFATAEKEVNDLALDIRRE